MQLPFLPNCLLGFSPLFVVFMPFLNFILFVFFGRTVNRQFLAFFVVSTMVLTLANLLLSYAEIAGGIMEVTTVGNWVSSGLFEVN